MWQSREIFRLGGDINYENLLLITKHLQYQNFSPWINHKHANSGETKRQIFDNFEFIPAKEKFLASNFHCSPEKSQTGAKKALPDVVVGAKKVSNPL
jgi:hypothetical protein